MKFPFSLSRFERYFVSAVVVLYAAAWIFVTVRHGAAVPPGDDSNFHLKTIGAIIGGEAVGSPNYPVGFHYLVATLARIFSIDPVKFTIGVFALLLPLSSLAVYFATRSMFGKAVALTSFSLYTLISLQPMQTLYDGGLPNVFAAGILLPIFFACYLKFLEADKKLSWRYGVFSLLLALLLFLTHHLSALYLSGVVIVATPFLAFFAEPNLRRKQLWWFGGAVVIGLIGLIASGVLTPTINLVRQVVEFSPSFPFINLIGKVQDPGWFYATYREYKEGIGPTLVVLGSFYPVACLVLLWRRGLKRAHLLILVWLVLLLVASRLSGLGVPARAAKDMALPLAIGGGVILSVLWQERKSLGQVIVVTITALILIGGTIDMMDKFVRLDDLTRMFRVTKADKQLILPIQGGTHVAIYGVSQLHGHVRPDIKFTNLYSQQESPLNVWLGEFDYLIVEMGEWPNVTWNEALLNELARSNKLKLVQVIPQDWKTVFLYQVLED